MTQMEGFGASESRYCPGDRRRLNLPASPRVRVNVRRALRPGGRLLVVETVIPPGNDPNFGKLLDLNMLFKETP